MVERYHLYSAYGDNFMCQVGNEKGIDKDDQYVELEDFEKLRELFLSMKDCVDSCNGYESAKALMKDYKKLVGE